MARRRRVLEPPTNGDHVTAPVDDPPPREPPPEPEAFETARPVWTVRYGYVKACVWANSTEHGIRYNTTFARIYRVDGDQWSQSTSFGARDLPLVEKCAAAALEYIRAQYDEIPF